ncbi:MAG: hypothetical protein COX07_09470 [Bacteroidetes bacterium CG23_combo_of_CG06-09_8_20_14_all_32_9]|nr:MAG: hypothetical protein COX07_09470 [Bacteroidetes bacterium CG23_combo_of_CG06-09_8_20_14_all_32_9]
MKSFYNITVLFALAIVYINTHAQSITFEKTFGDNGCNESGSCVRQTSDGGYIILGTNTGDGTTIFAALILIKTDSLGNIVWSKDAFEYGVLFSWANNLEITSDGGYIIVGSISDANSTVRDVLLIKTDSLGNKEWHQTYDSLSSDMQYGSHEEGRDVKQTNDGGYILTGVAGSMGAASCEMIILKTDSTGNKLWLKKYTGLGKAIGNSIVECENGNYLILGYTTLSAPDYLMYLVKTDANGNKIWDKTYNWNLGDFTMGIDVKFKNNVNGEYFLLGNGHYFGNQGAEMFLIKTDTTGNNIWQKNYKINNSYSSLGYDFDITEDGGFVLAGTISFFDNNIDVYMVKTDSAGNITWDINIGDSSMFEGAYSIRQTTDKGYIITGGKNGCVYLIKTDSIGHFTTEINEFILENSMINVYPNPFNVETTININNDSFRRDKEFKIKLILYDILGKEQDLSYKFDKSSIKLMRGNLKNGIYFYKIISENNIIDAGKIVVNQP